MQQRRDPRQVLILHFVPASAELRDDAGDMDRVPDQHGVGQQAEAARLVHDLLVVAGPEVALIGEEQPLGQDVAKLPAVQLQLNGLAQRRLVNVAQDVDGFDQAAERGQRLGEPVGRRGVDQPLQNDVGGCGAVP